VHLVAAPRKSAAFFAKSAALFRALSLPEISASAASVPLGAPSENPARGAIWLDVNGVRKQTGDLSQMIWGVPHQIAFLSSLFALTAGDLIFTGTPSGVGAVKKGDRLNGYVDGVGDLDVAVI